ncbi:MAG: hypothetical protein A3F72_14635 [Bacteroidetes bacterium RIFCSPLOWO2_12_FULL_35_15]|nr:MAG: hypothetical protein A3F72_14635 [Bacteroidetes bacterium RIFCSPLOWO2_12_FULL_35_15]
MQKLSYNWFTEKQVDFEYKKYILLAYFQEVKHDFDFVKLYPVLSDLITQYRNTLAFVENKNRIQNLFPQKVIGIDSEQLHLQYEQLIQDDKLMLEIETIINYSLPKFEYYLEEGKKIYDFINEHLKIFPVGVIPLHIQEGYLLLKDTSENNVKAYQYAIKLSNTPDENYGSVATDFVEEYRCTFSNTFENIKLHLIKQYKNLPNPATYAIDTDINIPLQETYLPIAKRILVKYISQC